MAFDKVRALAADPEPAMPQHAPEPVAPGLQQAAAEPAIADAMELEDEILEELQDIERRLDLEQERADREQARAEQERLRADAERAEKERLPALLRQAGLDPEQPDDVQSTPD